MEIPRVVANQPAGPTRDPAYGSAPNLQTGGIMALGRVLQDYMEVDKKIKEAANEVDVLEAMSTVEEELARRRMEHLEDPDYKTYFDRRNQDLEDLKAEHIYSIADPLTRDKAAQQFRKLSKQVRIDAYAESRQMKIDQMQAVGTSILIAEQDGIKNAENADEALRGKARATRLAADLMGKRLMTDTRYKEEVAQLDKAVYSWIDRIVEENPESLHAYFKGNANPMVKEMLEARVSKVWVGLNEVQKTNLREKAQRLADAASTQRLNQAAQIEAAAIKHRERVSDEFAARIYRRLHEGEPKDKLHAEALQHYRDYPATDTSKMAILKDLNNPADADNRVYEETLFRLESGGRLGIEEIAKLKMSPGQKHEALKYKNDKAARNSVTDADAFRTGESFILTQLGSSIGAGQMDRIMTGSGIPSEAADALGRARKEYLIMILNTYPTRDSLANRGAAGHLETEKIATAIVRRYQDMYPNIFKKAETVKPAGQATPKSGSGTDQDGKKTLRPAETSGSAVDSLIQSGWDAINKIRERPTGVPPNVAPGKEGKK
jgi:hypothetical protein